LLEDFNQFINDSNNKNFFSYIKMFHPESIFVILDSDFARLNIVRKYSGRIPIFSTSIERESYGLICKIDQSEEILSPKDFVRKYTKPLFIMGIGLYGQLFIKDVRIFEKLKMAEEHTNYHSPIIIFGSPREEKLATIHGLFDLYINNTDPSAFLKLDYVISNVVISN